MGTVTSTGDPWGLKLSKPEPKQETNSVVLGAIRYIEAMKTSLPENEEPKKKARKRTVENTGEPTPEKIPGVLYCSFRGCGRKAVKTYTSKKRGVPQSHRCKKHLAPPNALWVAKVEDIESAEKREKNELDAN